MEGKNLFSQTQSRNCLAPTSAFGYSLSLFSFGLQRRRRQTFFFNPRSQQHLGMVHTVFLSLAFYSIYRLWTLLLLLLLLLAAREDVIKWWIIHVRLKILQLVSPRLCRLSLHTVYELCIRIEDNLIAAFFHPLYASPKHHYHQGRPTRVCCILRAKNRP